MAAVLGGTQSLHTNSLDEAYALPSEEAVTIALRTQQIIAHESNVTATADPLGGSYFVEKLTSQVEDAAVEYMRRIDDMGGMIPAIERGFPQGEIANASYEYQHEIETGERVIVGVNGYTESASGSPDLLHVDESAQVRRSEQVAAMKARRNNGEVERRLGRLRTAALAAENTMPFILDCVRAYATVGEICDAFRDVFGTYTETSVL
jgi:methylmalonyl-CoA mutase N-terminal domain/subunit